MRTLPGDLPFNLYGIPCFMLFLSEAKPSELFCHWHPFLSPSNIKYCRSVCCDSIATKFGSHHYFNTLPSALHYYLPALSRPSGPTRGHCRVGTYLVTSGCTYGLNTVSFHSISLSVYFDAVSGLRPVSQNVCLLAGIVTTRPSAFCGR